MNIMEIGLLQILVILSVKSVYTNLIWKNETGKVLVPVTTQTTITSEDVQSMENENTSDILLTTTPDSISTIFSSTNSPDISDTSESITTGLPVSTQTTTIEDDHKKEVLSRNINESLSKNTKSDIKEDSAIYKASITEPTTVQNGIDQQITKVPQNLPENINTLKKQDSESTSTPSVNEMDHKKPKELEKNDKHHHNSVITIRKTTTEQNEVSEKSPKEMKTTHYTVSEFSTTEYGDTTIITSSPNKKNEMVKKNNDVFLRYTSINSSDHYSDTTTVKNMVGQKIQSGIEYTSDSSVNSSSTTQTSETTTTQNEVPNKTKGKHKATTADYSTVSTTENIIDYEFEKTATVKPSTKDRENPKYKCGTPNEENHTGNQYESTSCPDDETTTEAMLVPTCEVSSIILDEKTIEKTEISTKWKLNNNNSIIDASCNFKLFISCDSTDPSLNWRVLSQSAVKEVVNITTIIILFNLSEYTNYVCESELRNDYDDVLAHEKFSFATDPEVPSVVNFNFTNVTARSISLEWDPPYKIPGNLKSYRISLKNYGPLHYVRHRNISDPVELSVGNETFFHKFDGLQPNNEYEIIIQAEDEVGFGKGTPQRISTKNSRSTEPLNITTELGNPSDHCSGRKYNSTLLIKWELPWNTNGKLKEFQIKIFGSTYKETFSSGLHRCIYPSGYLKTRAVRKNENFEDLSYQLFLSDLNASSVYNFTIAAISEDNIYGIPGGNRTYRTPDGCPSKPINATISYIAFSSFIIKWSEPQGYYGVIWNYEVEIERLPSRHYVSEDNSCGTIILKESKTDVHHVRSTQFKFYKALPHFNYRVRIRGQTSAGFGEYSNHIPVDTRAKASDRVRDLEITSKKEDEIFPGVFKYTVIVKFKPPCNTNGQFEFYQIRIFGVRSGYPDDTHYVKKNEINDTQVEILLTKPECKYTFLVKVSTSENFQSDNEKGIITTSAGIPKIDAKQVEYSLNSDTPTQIDVMLNKNMFSDEMGNILYYAIIIMRAKTNHPINRTKYTDFGFWNHSNSWLMANESVSDYNRPIDIVQLTQDFWNPFTENKHQFNLTIGKTTDCASTDHCQPLLEDTNYIVLIRGLTASTYSGIYTVVQTGSNSSNVGLIIMLLFFISLIIAVGTYLYLMKKKEMWIRFRTVSDVTVIEPAPRYAVAVKHFISYTNKVKNDPLLLKKQYEEIEDEAKLYKEKSVHTTFGTNLENRRKNRYTNILPFDEFRVKLNMDEDDEISSDYINASYIRGYSGDVEYIAAQGPLEHTSKDFWKMVVQENVTVIVMVSQFVEKEKEKCFKYFPNNHGTMLISENIEVKCLTELQFEAYSIRTLLVRKDARQYSVIHMQYLDWPDFGCPTGTNNMLSFCQEVRDRIQLEEGLMVVHCSAGVGRTGTLISLDILLQSIKKRKEISVFETVSELRRQRTHMVQTEKQYVYIHTCIKEALENASLYLCDDTKKNEEHTYINTTSLVDGSPKNELGFKEKESAF